MKQTISIIPLILLLTMAFAQQPDMAKYASSPSGFMQKEIMKDVTGKEGDAPDVQKFVMDFDGKTYPTDPDKYTTVWHNEPVSQGLSGTCWAYSATSFIESEAYRKSGHKVKLSELFTVYWEYVARAEEFVRTRGNIELGEGSEASNDGLSFLTL